MGSALSGALGLTSQYEANPYQAGNPYSQDVLNQDLQHQAQIYQQQQQLAQMLANQAAGQGPNPAQTQYMQNVQNNVNNAQGLIASQRGLNPALATRLGANTASNANQQAAMQSSLLQQNQQLGAQQNLGALYGNMQQGNIAQQGLYTGGNEAAMKTNAAVAGGNQQALGQLYGGLIGAGGKAIAAAAHGGMIEGYASGGEVGPQSFAGQYFKSAMNMKSGGPIPGTPQNAVDSLKNDTVPIMASPGEIMIPKSVAMDKDAPDKAKAFVAAVLAEKGRRLKK